MKPDYVQTEHLPLNSPTNMSGSLNSLNLKFEKYSFHLLKEVLTVSGSRNLRNLSDDEAGQMFSPQLAASERRADMRGMVLLI